MKRTVFIVGAGASADFGFPLGAELAAEIRDGLDREREGGGRSPIVDALSSSPGGFGGAQQAAMDEIRGGLLTAPSIDFFLETRSDRSHVVHVGKVAIAHSILAAERRCTLSGASDSNFNATQAGLKAAGSAWTATLLKGLAGRRRPESATALFDDVAFVVFNYDRCLEQYLYHAIQHVFAMNFFESAGIMKGAKIFHPFGSLGPIPMAGQQGVGFGSERANPATHAPGLTTFYEAVADQSALTDARRELASAERLVFLGFGFHPRNLELLFPDEVPSVEMWGTLWLEGPERLAAMEFLGVDRNGQDDYGIPRWEKASCGDFLRARSHSIFGAEG